ncbi:MAG: glycosyltransferase family 9 protein [Gammaproteobacteria bacterium]|nr:glycosyltransferase family 9 protein [Gammaproteobacteria bacterium]MDH5801757.1 glycosyltransferase family 9 protein [Gammaproteobacteria bacterium]
MTQNPPTKILVVRNDKLGDFMLCYPAFALLKQALPQAQIHALVPQYTRDMAATCPSIDQVLIDPDPKNGSASQLCQLLRAENFDAVITLFSTTRVAWATFRARIPYRLAPATKIAQIFYNHRLLQRRSRSEKPEYEYNLDLIRQFLRDHHIKIPAEPQAPFLQFEPELVNQLKQDFLRQNNIPAHSRLLFVHCGSGGSANNLSPQQYAKLITGLASDDIHFVLSAGPGELEMAQQLQQTIAPITSTIYQSSQGLIPFAQHLQFADLFISGSTGPLHIAGALNRPTAAFYTRRRSATPLRWQTCNQTERRLAFTPADDAEEMDMSRVDIPTACAAIQARFL